jgi:small subunit ribosomal protein S1
MSDSSTENEQLNKAGIAKDPESYAAVEESFADLLEKSVNNSSRLGPGQKVRALVISVSGDLVYIDLGGKSEGVINLSEFMDDKGACNVKAGDEVEAYFVSVEDGHRKLTTLVKGYSATKLNAIQDARDAGVPINGEVKAAIKGGFDVSVGGIRCFCPYSQMDLRVSREGGDYVGRTFPFKVVEFEEDGKNVVLSRRILLEEERQVKVEELKQSLKIGMELKGIVRSLQNFGAFVDIGGMDGMIPASELSWDRSGKPGDIVKPGQEVTVRVIALDWETNRLTLSLKAMQPDPWLNIQDRYQAGDKVNGTIVRLAPFGVFVNLESGIDGLIHISNLGAGRRIKHPKEVVQAGQEIEAYILSVEPDNRRISLSLQPKSEPKQIEYPDEGAIIDGVVEKVLPFGIFVKINEGLTGLVPNSEAGTARGTDHSRMFTPGMPVQVMVLEVDREKGRVSLSRKQVASREEDNEVKEYMKTVKKEEKASDGMGILGEKLKAVMEEKKISF